MKRLLLLVGLGATLLLCWVGWITVRHRGDLDKTTASDLAEFRQFLRRARRELAIHSMEETGRLQELNLEFAKVARDAQGNRGEEMRSYAKFFSEFVYFNRDRAQAAVLMKDKAFLHFGTVRQASDLRDRRAAVQRLRDAIAGVTNKMNDLEGFVREQRRQQKLPPETCERSVRQLMTEVQPDRQFVLDLCRIHTRYADNVTAVLDLLVSELGNWGARADGTVIFRRKPALDAYAACAETSRQLVAEDLALRQQNAQ